MSDKKRIDDLETQLAYLTDEVLILKGAVAHLMFHHEIEMQDAEELAQHEGTRH